MNDPRLRYRSAGFARSDALAVITTLALLAGLFLSTAAGTRATSEAVLCRVNLKQLSQAWQAYALDHSDRLIGSPEGAKAQSAQFDEEFWATGWLSWDFASANTNRAFLQMPAFVPYVGRDSRLFRCPSDKFLSGPMRQRGWVARVRSYSMNYSFGPVENDVSPLLRFQRLADVPDPAGYFVFLEEHSDSINDPTFITTFGNTGWVDLPATFHDRSANFAFSDTHVETRRWVSERTVLPVRFSNFLAPSVTASDPDFRWVLDRTSVKGK